MAEVSKLRRAQLPTELLREVVQYYAQTVAWREPENPRHSYKPRWSDFEPLTLTSKVLRQLALEAWFEVYYAQSPGDLLHVWPEVGVWTRELHCVDLGTDLKICPVQWCLRAFRRLRKLRVDFDPAQSNAMLLMRFDHPRLIASRLQELEVHDMSWPSPMIMGLVSDAFPGLRVLKLSQDLIWCSLCNTCCFPTFMDHPPQRIVYEKGLGLPIHYARYLAPLVHLHTICITVSYDLGGLLSLSQGNDTLWTNGWRGRRRWTDPPLSSAWSGYCVIRRQRTSSRASQKISQMTSLMTMKRRTKDDAKVHILCTRQLILTVCLSLECCLLRSISRRTLAFTFRWIPITMVRSIGCETSERFAHHPGQTHRLSLARSLAGHHIDRPLGLRPQDVAFSCVFSEDPLLPSSPTNAARKRATSADQYHTSPTFPR